MTIEIGNKPVDRKIAIDLLGGDAPERDPTITDDYEGDARTANNEALREALVAEALNLVGSRVGLVLYGNRTQTIGTCVDALQELGFSPAAIAEFFGRYIEFVDADTQAPMSGSGRERENSLGQLFRDLRQSDKIQVAFSNGSSKHMAAFSAGLRVDRSLPLFAKRNLTNETPFGDNGVNATMSVDDLVKMYEHLTGEVPAEQLSVQYMMLPSDEHEPSTITTAIKAKDPRAEMIPYDPIEFLEMNGQTSPDVILGDGFVGNVYLKSIEYFLKDKRNWIRFLSKSNREQLLSKMHRLDRSELKNWTITSLPPGPCKIGILANGTEDSKGTPELQALLRNLNQATPGYTAEFIEPEHVANFDGHVYATPATYKVFTTFLQDDYVGQTLLTKNVFRNVNKLIAAGREAVATAEIAGLKKRVFLGHGKANPKETSRIIQSLIREALSEKSQ